MILVILTLLLSLVSGGRQEAYVAAEAAGDSSGAVCCFADSLNGDLCITAAQGPTFAGGGGSNSVSARNTSSGRRISPQTRSAFRIVKGGKVIDNNRTHPFLTPFFVPLSGMRVSERYLLAICRLRL